MDQIVGIKDIQQNCLACGRQCANRRALGNHVNRAHKFDLKEYTMRFIGPNPKCECGCGKETLWNKTGYRFNEYFNGHNPSGFKLKQAQLSNEQVERRILKIRKSYKVRGDEIKKKISRSVSEGLRKSDVNFSEYFKEKWSDERFREAQHTARVKSWSGESGDVRRKKIFTEEFRRKIGDAKVHSDVKRTSSAGFTFFQRLRTHVCAEAIPSEWFDFNERKWCVDVWLPDSKTIVELDGDRYHGNDRDIDWTPLQISNITNDIVKNRIAIERGLNLVRISETDVTDLTAINSLQDLHDLAYHLVIDGKVVKEGTFRLEDDQPLITRERLILKHIKDHITYHDNLKDPRGAYLHTKKRWVPVIRRFLRAYVNYWGWFHQPVEGSASETVLEVRAAVEKVPYDSDVFSSTSSTGSKFLKPFMLSFWNTLEGPVKRFDDDGTLTRVIEYRIGVNRSKDYEYTLSDGRHVKVNEHFDISLKNIRRGFVVQRNAVSWFKPVTAGAIWRKLVLLGSGDHTAPAVWDPSAGFAARFVGFNAAFPDGKYNACEPSTEIHADFKRLLNDLRNEGINASCNVLLQGSELALPIDDGSVDAVFTSPPYFRTEQYFDEPGQCWRDHNTLERWIKNYLRPTFVNVARVLKTGCYGAFNVNPEQEQYVLDAIKAAGLQYVDTWSLTMNRDHFSKRHGKLEGRSEPIIVFKKH